jgi:adenylate cyclase
MSLTTKNTFKDKIERVLKLVPPKQRDKLARTTRFILTLIPFIFGALHATNYLKNDFISSQDAKIYDNRMKSNMSNTLDPRIVIIDIDEKSLARVGQWPWGRHLLADLVIELVDRQGAAAVGFDFVFAEADSRSTTKTIRNFAQTHFENDLNSKLQLELEAQKMDYDEKFAKVIQNRPVVLGYYFSADRQKHVSGILPKPVYELSPNEAKIGALQWNGYGSNIPTLVKTGANSGFFNAVPDEDGVIRYLPVLAEYEGKYYESFGIKVWRTAFGGSSVAMKIAEPNPWSNYKTLEYFRLDATQATINPPQQQPTFLYPTEEAAVLVPYRGSGGPNGGSFEYISAVDILNKKLSPQSLKNKIVLVGTTAPGLQDLRNTPVSSAFPGVEVHANLISGALDGNLLYIPDTHTDYEIITLIAMILLMLFGFKRFEALPSFFFGVGILLIIYFCNLIAYVQFGMIMPLASTLSMGIAALAINMSFGYYIEGRSKRALAAIFGTYVHPKIVAQMSKSPHSFTMLAQNKHLTVMFCDLRGFTNMASKLDPKAVQELLFIVFNQFTNILIDHNATIDKYMGDCVMAFWGAPVEMNNHEELAVKAALNLRDALPKINLELINKGLPTVDISIGIATGEVAVGDMGSEVRRSYTVIGDAVNLASRLQNLCGHFGVDIITCSETQKSCRTLQYKWEAIPDIQVKGFDQPITAYSVETEKNLNPESTGFNSHGMNI